MLLTGASGFLGKAVLATLLAGDPPPARVLVLLRAPDQAAADRRLREEVLGAAAFAGLDPEPLAEMLGSGRLAALAGDLAADLGPEADATLAGVETVVNCAASVSFEEPLDTILELNACGPARLLRRLRAVGARPHFVHVSTAYAADCRLPVVHEQGPIHPGLAALDPDALLAEARDWRRQLRASGAAAERALVGRGRSRAVAAGWPDTYALSKALGEQGLLECGGPLTIVRPSIIESALRSPRPGWLEGIKVADPLILAYAGGGLTHIAGDAANRIDIVPVDLVANACAAASLAAPPDAPRTIAIASGARNPLRIGELAEIVRRSFAAEPLRRRDGSPIPIGELAFVSRRRAAGRAATRHRLAAGIAALAPPARRKRLRKQAALAGQVRRMVDIYAPYTELDCVFDDAEAQALAAALPPPLREALPFDPAEFTWDDYLTDVHLPELRRLAAGRSSRPTPPVPTP